MSANNLKATDKAALGAFAPAGEPDWLKAGRTQAREAFLAQNWPGRRDEEWRRTPMSKLNVEGLTLDTFKPAAVKVEKPAEGFAGVLKFADGQLVSASLDPALAAKGVIFADLSAGWKSAPDLLKGSLGSFKTGDDRFAAWHHSLTGLGLVLSVPKNVVVDLPFVVEYSDSRSGLLVSPHHVVKLGDLAGATLITRLTSTADSTVLYNTGADYTIGDAAEFRLVEIQTLGQKAAQVDHSSLSLGRDTKVKHLHASVGGAVVKTKFTFHLTGSGSELITHGMYFGRDDQHKDIRVVQYHEAPDAHSSALYKGAVRDRSRTVFQGLIEVTPNGARTDAYLSNKNLVLNDGARADSLPQLRIDTNDVKCSHGSTTGKVDEDEIFYLLSRGFSRNEARLLIAEGLFAELIDGVPELLREELEGLVATAIGG